MASIDPLESGAAVRVEGLTKIFPPNLKAVDNVSFSVKDGEIFGLLGPNGAGKTTIIKSIMTLTIPTSGQIIVRGVDVRRAPAVARQMMGYVPQEVSVDGDLTAYENLLIFAKFYYVERSIRKERIDEALAYMGLAERASDLVKTFSGGMMRRLEIAQALVNRPRVLFLDEPSIGLDPSARIEVWKHIQKMKAELGTTIFLTTHDMLEAEKLCQRLAIMNEGKIVVTGTPDELKESVGKELVSVKFGRLGQAPREVPRVRFPETLGVSLMEKGAVAAYDQRTQGDEEVVLVKGKAEDAVPGIVRAYENEGVDIASISVSKPTLDDVFLKYTSTRISEAETGKQARSTRRSFRRHAR